MRVEILNKAEVAKISKLYFETVQHINSKDYSPSQIRAWSPRPESDDFWLSRWEDCLVLVAKREDDILGFVELRPHGEIDCFYVSHLAQRSGVGRLMIERVFDHAQKNHMSELWADVSLTAKPFFSSMGFYVEREQVSEYRGESFKQFLMKKKMA